MIGILDYLERENIPALLISVDFEKCFDMVEKDALIGSMQFFNIGKTFIEWILLLYESFESCTINSGFTSGWFQTTRAIHQVAPWVVNFFLICTEVLALQLQSNERIKPIVLCATISHLLAQYADYMDHFTTYDASSLQAIIDTDVYLNIFNVIDSRPLIHVNGPYWPLCDIMTFVRSFDHLDP